MKQNHKALYLGDTTLNTDAAYLAGIMNHYQIEYDYLASHEQPEELLSENAYRLLILSDYPAANFSPGQLGIIARRVEAGMGLVIIGGWDSFQGLNGGYAETVLAEIFPVQLINKDDRVNSFTPCIVMKQREHEIVSGLPFSNPPCVGGLNRVNVRENGTLLLSARRYRTELLNNECLFIREEEYPLLVIGTSGSGRISCFTSDVAPHWVGGLVDWGSERIRSKVGKVEIEVGNFYARFFRNLLLWTGRLGENHE